MCKQALNKASTFICTERELMRKGLRFSDGYLDNFLCYSYWVAEKIKENQKLKKDQSLYVHCKCILIRLKSRSVYKRSTQTFLDI